MEAQPLDIVAQPKQARLGRDQLARAGQHGLALDLLAGRLELAVEGDALVLLARLAAEGTDGEHLARVVTTFRDALRNHQDELNRLNVYPVPDGDTGTNMALTLESVAGALAAAGPGMSAVCGAIAHAMAGLPPDQRLAAQLFFVEGLTLAEMAILAAIPQSPTRFDLVRNAVVECQVEIWPTSMVFRKGHKLRLDITEA